MVREQKIRLFSNGDGGVNLGARGHPRSILPLVPGTWYEKPRARAATEATAGRARRTREPTCSRGCRGLSSASRNSSSRWGSAVAHGAKSRSRDR